MFKDSTDLIRSAILLRYRMAPYLYSCEYEAAKNGAPIMRALVYSFDFLFGKSLLVANVIEKDAASRRVYLPAGLRWYDMNDNYRCYEGGQTIEVPVTMVCCTMMTEEPTIKDAQLVVSFEDFDLIGM